MIVDVHLPRVSLSRVSVDN